MPDLVRIFGRIPVQAFLFGRRQLPDIGGDDLVGQVG